MKKLIILFVCIPFLFSCQKTKKQNLEVYSSVVSNSEKFSSLDSLLSVYIESNKIPGAVALVSQGGELIYHKAHGFNDLEKETPQKTSDIFRLASMTKPITSVAAMILFEEGKFELDDLLSKYIPEFSNPQILESINFEDSTFTSKPAKREITIRQIFTHSSGIAYGFDDEKLELIYAKLGISEGFEERDILLADNVSKIAQLPIMHEPGEKFTYGLSTDVLGRLIEIWSGMPLDQFMKVRIFGPLEMNDTYFYLPEEKFDRLTKVYMFGDSGLVETDYPLIYYPIRGAKKYLSGGADLSSTAYDYYLFCQMMLNKGELNGKRILKEETIDLMTATHLETGDDDMGLGWSVLSAKTKSTLARSVGSISWGGFFTTTFWIDPKENLSAILLLQMYPFDYWEIQSEFENIIYRDL